MDPFWQCLICSFKAAPVANAKAAVVRIETMTGIRLSESPCRRGHEKDGHVLEEECPDSRQGGWTVPVRVLSNPTQTQAGRGSRGPAQGFLCRRRALVLSAFLGLVWCFARPFIKTAPGRQRDNVLGAIDSHSKGLIRIRNTGYIDGGVVCLLLAAIRTRHPSEAITLVLDNARYQRCVLVMDKANELGIELLFLPAYSPNLNLIE